MLTEVIVKYIGDIEGAVAPLGAVAERLSSSIAILTMDESKIPLLDAIPQILYAEMPMDVSPRLSESLYHACVPDAQDYGLTGEGVIVAVIDSGIDYTHPDFINDDGTTRILYLWDMTAKGTPPDGFVTGHLYTADDLNAALATPNPLAVIGQIDTNGHGTAVASVAAGNGRASGGKEVGVAPRADIVAVKLGRSNVGTGETMQGARTVEIMRGLKFVSDVCQARDAPCAINISFGTNQGAHDGASLFEEYVNEIANTPKTAVVAAAGNEASAGHHFSGKLATGESDLVDFNVSGGITRLYLVMWKDFADDFAFELISPTGKTSGVVRAVDRERRLVVDGTALHIRIGQPTHYNPDQLIYIEMQGNPYVAQGAWQLAITSQNSVTGDYQLWLPTIEEVGRGTAFARPKADYTVTMPATAANVIAVGAYNAAYNSYAEFSGRGMIDDHLPTKPDIVAPGVNVLAAATGGGYDTFSGTSIAAPFVTGAAALLMEWGIKRGNDTGLYGQRLKAYLRHGASRNPYNTYPNERWGYGALCLKATLDYLRDTTMHSTSAESSVEAARRGEKNYEDMSLAEFVRLPDVVDIITKYDIRFINYIKDKPYIKQGALIANDFVIAYLPEDKLTATISGLNDSYLHTIPRLFGPLGRSSLIASGILQVQERPYLDLRGRGVLLAFIDTGIDYTLPAFRYEDGSSKIAALWDMTADHVSEPNETVYIGRDYSKSDIDEALRAAEPLSVLPQQDTAGHGTFLASVAAGREDNEYIGAAPDAELVVVKLRKANSFLLERYNVPKEQENAFSSNDLMLGIQYIIRKAGELSRPISVCISLGTTFGSHDGFDPMDDYITSLARRPGIAFCTAAGNEANTKRHARGKLDRTGDVVPVEIRVGDNVPSATAYFWNKPQDSMFVSITSPTGEIVLRRSSMRDERFSQRLVLEKSTVHINYFFPVSGSGSDLAEIIIDTPTPGIWTVNVHGSLVLEGGFQAWMPLTGFMSNEVEFISPSPNYTIVMPATALGAITCGAYDEKSNSLYTPSSWGPTAFPIISPELAAPGVNVQGTFPTGRGTMSGTSVAAAITAGAAALMLQWGVVDGNYPQLNNIRIRSFLVRGCARDPMTTYPNDQWGFGRLDLMQSFNTLRGM